MVLFLAITQCQVSWRTYEIPWGMLKYSFSEDKVLHVIKEKVQAPHRVLSVLQDVPDPDFDDQEICETPWSQGNHTIMQIRGLLNFSYYMTQTRLPDPTQQQKPKESANSWMQTNTTYIFCKWSWEAGTGCLLLCLDPGTYIHC